jgi:hypothetical protein
MPEVICRGSQRSAKGVGRARRRGLGRSALGLLVVLAAWAPAGAAQAEPTAAERAQAEGLLGEAHALLASGHPAAACPKIEESHRLSPSTGTKLELARCHESTGRFASAWALYTEVDAAEAAGGDAKRGAEARARAAAMEQKLSRLAIRVSDEVKALPGIEVTLDGVAAKGAGAARPVEPGEHKAVAAAPGGQAIARDVEAARSGEVADVHVGALAPGAPAREPAPFAGDGEPRRPTPYGTRPDPIHRNLMWVTGGLTLAGIALGSTFGGLAISTWDKVDDAAKTACANPRRYRECAHPVPDLASKAMSYATVSDFSFIAAGAALAGTAVLWLTLPPDGPRASARVGLAPGIVGGSVLGVF